MCSTTDSVRPLLFLPSNWTCCVCQLNTPISWLPKHTVNWAYAWMTWVNVLSSGSWKGRAFLCQGSETLWPEKKWTAKITEGGLAALRLPLCGSDLQIKSLKVRNLSNRLLQVALFCVTITKTWAFSSCLEFSLSLIELLQLYLLVNSGHNCSRSSHLTHYFFSFDKWHCCVWHLSGIPFQKVKRHTALKPTLTLIDRPSLFHFPIFYSLDLFHFTPRPLIVINGSWQLWLSVC